MFSGVLSCTDTKTQGKNTAYNPETAVCLFPEATERVVSGFQAVV